MKPSERMEKRLLNFKKKFDPQLASLFDKKISQVKKVDSQALDLVEQIKDLTLRGGKRLRPAFLYYGFRACGGEDERLVWRPCLAIELLHSMALIHDDIMDKAELRRGGPAVHQVLGVSGAILAGDLCFSWAEELFEGGKARKYWNLLKEEVILGQFLETAFSYDFNKIETRPHRQFIKLEKEVLKVLEYKTARYTIVRPLQIGAVLAGAGKKELKILENYGVCLGIAFQIVDDILGMFGDEEVTGKPVGADLKEGKITVLVVKTINALKAQGSRLKVRKLLKLLGNEKINKKDLEWVRGLVKETGALEYCQKKAESLARKAKKAIEDYPFEKEDKEFLLGMADFLIKREY